MMKKDNKSELRQRFGFRKLASGMLVSGIIGAFFLVGGQSVQADTNANASDVSAAVVETPNKQDQSTEADTKQEVATTNDTKEVAETTAPETEVKDNAKLAESTEAPKEDKQKVAADTETEADKQAKVAPAANTQDNQINFGDWDYVSNDNGVTINRYKRTDVADVVIPNTYDFVNAGLITDGKKASITNGALREIARTTGVKSITVSHNGDGKLYVAGNSLKQAFETTYMTPTVETIDVSNLDITGVNSLQSLFYGETNLKQIIGLDKWDVSNIDMLNATFDLCENLDLATWQSIAKWDVSKVSNFVATFAGSNLTDLTLLKNWNTSSATNMNATFMGINGLTTLNGLQNWNVSNVTNFTSLFENDNQLTDLSAIKDWNTSKVVNMHAMFWITKSLTDLSPIANWNTSNVTDMGSMFNSAKSLTNIDVLANWDVSKVTDMSYMFYQTGVKGLVNLANWNLNSNVNTDKMFAYYNIKTPNGGWTYANSPIMILVKSGNEQINKGNQVFYYHYLTYFNAGKDATLSEGWPYYASYAYDNLESAKEHFDKLLKTTAASKDGYTFKGWRGVAGTEYGNTGLYGEYVPIFESNKPVTPEKPENPDTPDVPVNPDTPMTPDNPDTPGPVQPTNPDDNNNGDNNNGANDNTVNPLPEKPANGNSGKKNDINTNVTKNNANSAVSLTNTTVKAASFGKNKAASELPQTGSENTNVWTALGLGLVSALGLFGLAKRKKRN